MKDRIVEDISAIKQEITILNQQINKDNQNVELRFKRAQLYINAFRKDEEQLYNREYIRGDESLLYEDKFWSKAYLKVLNDLKYIEKKGIPHEQKESFYKFFAEYYVYFDPLNAYDVALKYYNIANNKAEALFYLIRICSMGNDPSRLELALVYNSEYLTLPNIDYEFAIREKISILTQLGDFTKALKVLDDAIENNSDNKELLYIKYTFLNSRLYDNINNEQCRNDFFEYGIDYISSCPNEHNFEYYFNSYFSVYEEIQIPLNEIYYALKKLGKTYGDKDYYFCQLARYHEKNNELQLAINYYEQASEVGEKKYYADIYRLYSIQGDKIRANEAFEKININGWRKWSFANNVIFDLNGYPHDFELGFRLAKEYADEYPDYECALRLLALCYEYGLGVEKNPPKAYELYHRGLKTKGTCGCCALGYILCKLYGNGTDKDINEAKRVFLVNENRISNLCVPETFARITLESPDNYFTSKKAIKKLVEKEKNGSPSTIFSDSFLLLYKLSKSNKKKQEYRSKFMSKYLTDSTNNKIANARFVEENNLDLPLFISDI